MMPRYDHLWESGPFCGPSSSKSGPSATPRGGNAGNDTLKFKKLENILTIVPYYSNSLCCQGLLPFLLQRPETFKSILFSEWLKHGKNFQEEASGLERKTPATTSSTKKAAYDSRSCPSWSRSLPGKACVPEAGVDHHLQE